MTQTLTAESNISHYRIVSKIGAGGMGQIDFLFHRVVGISYGNRRSTRLY